ncbi:MAG: lipoate--protein ligase family protein [Deltaproteobacteria bacterium]|nr:lipoate--protein ligase family protein [Deltaproteobacteria bacterium]
MESIEVFRSFGGMPDRDLAFEEVQIARARGGAPSISLYSWGRPVLVLGYGQDPASVDLAACRALGVPVRRRVTGGTGVLHTGDLAVSLALPADHAWARGIRGLYGRFVDSIAASLHGLGARVEKPADLPAGRPVRSPICFEALDRETLLVGGRKAVGCAQARRSGAVLVHAVLLLGLDADLQARVYGVTPDRIRAALAPVPVPDSCRPLLPDALTDAITFAIGLRPEPAVPPPLPPDLAGRYADPRWAPA